MSLFPASGGDNKYTVASGVEITSYNTSSNKYTIPSDGYICLWSISNNIRLVAFFEGGLRFSAMCVNSKNAFSSMYVKKGMTVYFESDDATYGKAYFHALS